MSGTRNPTRIPRLGFRAGQLGKPARAEFVGTFSDSDLKVLNPHISTTNVCFKRRFDGKVCAIAIATPIHTHSGMYQDSEVHIYSEFLMVNLG